MRRTKFTGETVLELQEDAATEGNMSRGARAARVTARPYWQQADEVDLGGELRARCRDAGVVLKAE